MAACWCTDKNVNTQLSAALTAAGAQPTATTTVEFRAIEAAYEQAYELVFGSGAPPSKVEGKKRARSS